MHQLRCIYINGPNIYWRHGKKKTNKKSIENYVKSITFNKTSTPRTKECCTVAETPVYIIYESVQYYRSQALSLLLWRWSATFQSCWISTYRVWVTQTFTFILSLPPLSLTLSAPQTSSFSFLNAARHKWQMNEMLMLFFLSLLTFCRCFCSADRDQHVLACFPYFNLHQYTSRKIAN